MGRRKEVTANGAAICLWREHRGLTQRGLAALAGCSESLIAQAETGRRNLSRANADKIAAALMVPTAAIARLNEVAA